MTDIVERLRNPDNALLMLEAAAEIERLRAVLRVVYDWCGHDAPDWQEIERVLRAVLPDSD